MMNETHQSLLGSDQMEDPHPILSSFFDGGVDDSHVHSDDADRFGFRVASLFEGIPGPGSATKPKMEPFEEGTLLSLLTSPVKLDYDAMAHVPASCIPSSHDMPAVTPQSQMSDFSTATPLTVPASGTVTREFLPPAAISQPSPNYTSCSASPGLQPGRLFLSPPEQKSYSYSSFDFKPHPILSPPEECQLSEPSTAISLQAPHPILASQDYNPSPRAHPILSASPSEDNTSEGDVKPHPIFGSPEPPPPPRQPQQQHQQNMLRPSIITQGSKKRGRDQGITALGEDGFNWLKYGEKRLSSARRTRAYFRCSKSKELDCPAKKFVDILEEDPDGSNAMISYIQTHNHAKDTDVPLDATTSSPCSAPCPEVLSCGMPATPRGVTVIGQLSAVASQKLSHSVEDVRRGMVQQQPMLLLGNNNSCQAGTCSTPGVPMGVRNAHPLMASEQLVQRIYQ